MSSVNILFHLFSEPEKVKERKELEFHVNRFDWFTVVNYRVFQKKRPTFDLM